MSMMEPFLPHPVPEPDDVVPAADPGQGAEPAEGFGVGGEEPDQAEGSQQGEAGSAPRPNPFRPPTVAE